MRKYNENIRRVKVNEKLECEGTYGVRVIVPSSALAYPQCLLCTKEFWDSIQEGDTLLMKYTLDAEGEETVTGLDLSEEVE